MEYPDLLQKVADHVMLLYAKHPDERLKYHNLAHVTETLEIVKKMAEWYKLDPRDHFIVCAATLFHDTGFLLPDPSKHEAKSADLADTFLKSISVEESAINDIKKCILATRIPQTPASLTEQILCDADLFNLGTPGFREKNSRIKKEREALRGAKIKGREWRAKTIALLESHNYHTEYCRLLLEETKASNLLELKERQEKKLSKAAEEAPPGDSDDKPLPKPEKPAKRPDRGIETMLRVSFAGHQKLSALADNKAHIMISVNAIVISVTLGLVLRNYTSDNYLIIPTILLLFVNVTTIIFSVLATRPKIHHGFFTKEQLQEKRVNLLFYGSFYKMTSDAYEKAMRSMMQDSDFLYGTMIKDLYWQGRVMGRKFRLLHISYNIFMYGLAATIICYAVAAIISL